MEKRLIITDHAKQRMIERNITFDDVKGVIDFPSYTITKNGKIECYKNNLKIVYISKDKFIRIVTVIKK
jgi:hypothetical protein